jgi:hypothetical protein
MALTRTNLNDYFQKSERENLLQARIKAWTSFLRRKFADATAEEFSALSLMQKQMRFINRERDVPHLSVLNARLTFLPCVDTDNKPTCPASFKFLLDVGDKFYDLTVDQLPSRFIAPIYELLPEFARIMEYAYRGVDAEVESEVLNYLR